MAVATISGIASGIDTDSLIQAQSDAVRSARVNPLQDKITELTDQNEALETLRTKLQALQSLLADTSSLGGGLVIKSALSSDETVASATASNGTNNSSYSVTVTALATNGRLTIPSAGTFANGSTAMGAAGNITVTIGGTPITVSASASTTVDQFISAFNSDSENTGLGTAIAVNVGSSITPLYKILITTANTGAIEGGISATGITYNNTPIATDAAFSIAGIGAMTRSTNDVSDVIPGINFSLKAAGTTTIAIQNDSSATLASAKQIVKAFNEIVALIRDNNSVTREEDGEDVKNIFGTLAKTTTDDNALTLLRGALTASSYSSGGSVRIFADLGMKTNSSSYNSETKEGGGTLELDEDDFLAALASEPDSVNQIFKNLGDIAGRTASTVTINGVSVDGAVIHNFVKFNGMLDLSINSAKTQISNMNNRISDAERFISRQEESLRLRYARLEGLTGQLQSQSTALQNALAGLGG